MILTYFVSKKILTFKTVECTSAFPESFGQFIAFVYQPVSALQKKKTTKKPTKHPNKVLCLLQKTEMRNKLYQYCTETKCLLSAMKVT